MGSRRAASDGQPTLAANAYRRMWVIIGIFAGLGLLLAWVADLPLGLTERNLHAQARMTLGFVAVNAVMTVFRVDRNNALRRTNETLTEMWYVVGLFWLAPWALIIGRVVAAFTAWHFTKMRWQFRFYNAVIYAIVSIVLVRTYSLISPSSASDGWRAVAVASSVWFLNDVIRIGAHVILDGFRHDRFRFDVVWPSLSTSYLRLLACAFGLLIASALEVSPWTLPAVASVGVLFIVVSKADSRAASLDAGIEQISRFTAANAEAQRPDQVEQELLRSVEAFGRLATVAIARAPSGNEPTASRIEWVGRRRSGIDNTVSSSRDLVELSGSDRSATIDRDGATAVWSLDPERGTFLVVESAETVADQSDLWTTVGHLVDHARLAIDSVYKSQRLTALAEAEYERARTDPVTRLPNRVAALGEISARLAAPDDGPFSVVLIESDGYHESVNVLGLEFADATIVALAANLRQLMGRGDVDYVAHVAAAQFILIVPVDAARARSVAALACAGATSGRQEGHRSTEERVHRSASAGIATAAGTPTSAEELVRAASIALEGAADDQKIATFGPSNAARAERRMSIRRQLSTAIDTGEIFPEFQPQISMVTGVVSGCEVLARWRHGALGTVHPAEFIPIAERSGQVERLTLSIVEQALDAARYWGDDEPLDLSINVSARSLDSPAFVRALMRVVDEVGRSASSTTIEITESMLVDSASMLLALERMREIGFRISIDDFGTGYSALSYLDRLPADGVKVDKSMVQPIAPNRPVSPVVHHMIELCQTLGLDVCAKGVENQYQLHVLRSLGVDRCQGNLVSDPLDADAMTTWLAAHRVARSNIVHFGDVEDSDPAVFGQPE